ncbi:ATP-binding protein [Caulobacter sp. ErkDOM-YI]|uniref:ATP-binding protein n=1 Tax=unclassified Caulobacter TaxID=2648921 RepID=UPI003AF52276
MSQSFEVTSQQLDNLFPCYLLTNARLEIQSVGPSITRLLPGAVAGTALESLFVVERPITGLDPVTAARNKAAIQLRSRDGGIHLAGSVIELAQGYLFCLAHSIRAASTWAELGLTVADFSQADQSLAMGTAVAMQSVLMADMIDLVASLRTARNDAEAANRAKSTFLSVMSHEIRTPLNGILGMTQAMLQDAIDERQRSRLDIVQRSAESLLAILNDLLDLSRIEAGQMSLEAIAFDMGDLLSGAYAAFTALANKKGLSFTLDISAVEGRYSGDPTRIRQIAYNLISNAIKFTESGRVGLKARSTQDGLELAVFDTGVGIEPEMLNAIFEQFRQADVSINRRFGGTGLGLGIARNLAVLMGGSITVESVPGKGSTFTLLLPIPRTEEGEPAAVEPVMDTTEWQRTLRILAAEDNEINRLVLRTLLEPACATLTVVENGQQAVEAWSLQSWDVILMDIHMPVMGGLEASGAIREKERLTGRQVTPIIALTANAMAHQLEDYEQVGITATVAKPIQLAVLFSTLSEVLPG